jgi:hypothetical protein
LHGYGVAASGVRIRRGPGGFIALTPEEQAVAGQMKTAPKLADRLKDLAGKVWNAPNTAAGLALGAAGHVVGSVAHALGVPGVEKPRIAVGANAIQFMNNPAAFAGGLTLGNTTTYGDDPYSPAGRQSWAQTEKAEGHPIWEHERQHTYQGQQLGPAYLPANIIGGLAGLALDHDWHGDHNFMERGPRSNPSRPWAAYR